MFIDKVYYGRSILKIKCAKVQCKTMTSLSKSRCCVYLSSMWCNRIPMIDRCIQTGWNSEWNAIPDLLCPWYMLIRFIIGHTILKIKCPMMQCKIMTSLSKSKCLSLHLFYVVESHSHNAMMYSERLGFGMEWFTDLYKRNLIFFFLSAIDRKVLLSKLVDGRGRIQNKSRPSI